MKPFNAAKYFAYGSNLDLLQMKRRCPSSKLISKGSLSGYRLTFNRFSSGWGGGVADVIQAQDSKVWGLVFEISDTDAEFNELSVVKPELNNRLA